MRVRTAATVALAFVLVSCASASTQSAAEGSSRNRLTQEQLAATNSESLYDAVEKLRPEWLRSRGPTSVTDPTPTSVSIFMNRNFLGKAEYLRQMGVLDVTEVRYWDPGQASARFGMGHPRGVIEVVRK